MGCGFCSYCRAGYYAQFDNINSNGPQAGTVFFGGPQLTGPFDGLQAEYARIPYAATNHIKLPEHVTDEQAIMISDIFPTAYYGAELAEVSDGDTVAVFGCGPVGPFAITANLNEEEPVGTIQRLTGAIGVDRVVEAVGVEEGQQLYGKYEAETAGVAPESNPQGDN